MQPAGDRLLGRDLLRVEHHDLAEQRILQVQAGSEFADTRWRPAGGPGLPNGLDHLLSAELRHKPAQLLILALGRPRAEFGGLILVDHATKERGVGG